MKERNNNNGLHLNVFKVIIVLFYESFTFMFNLEGGGGGGGELPLVCTQMFISIFFFQTKCAHSWH